VRLRRAAGVPLPPGDPSGGPAMAVSGAALRATGRAAASSRRFRGPVVLAPSGGESGGDRPRGVGERGGGGGGLRGVDDPDADRAHGGAGAADVSVQARPSPPGPLPHASHRPPTPNGRGGTLRGRLARDCWIRILSKNKRIRGFFSRASQPLCYRRGSLSSASTVSTAADYRGRTDYLIISRGDVGRSWDHYRFRSDPSL
jgi:hypothetical protein